MQIKNILINWNIFFFLYIYILYCCSYKQLLDFNIIMWVKQKQQLHILDTPQNGFDDDVYTIRLLDLVIWNKW